MTTIDLLTYPARPVNGDPFDKAPPKIGQWAYEPKYNGWRTLVHAPTGSMFNRKGGPLSIASEFTRALEIIAVTVQVQKRAHIADPAVRAKWEQSLGAKSAPGSAPRLAPEWSAFKGRPTACSA